MSEPATQKESVVARRIAHLDMDAFYASVELLRRPELKGLPIAIGGRGDPNSRAVVTTATYEARGYGVRSGISLYKAKQLCSDLVMLPVDFAEYRRFSRLFKSAVSEYCPVMEDRGIDEVYLDLACLPNQSAEDIAKNLQARVLQATGLTCSIGIAPNKMLAKICSDLNKPNGITLLLESELKERIWPLPVKKINGVGPKANEKLASFGIETIGQLAQVPAHYLVKHFGRSYGQWLHESAQGYDNRAVVTQSEAVSVSRENTLTVNLHLSLDAQAVLNELTQLCESLAKDLQRKHVLAKQIGIKVKYDDFKGLTRDFTLREPSDQFKVVLSAALLCLHRVPTSKKIRLIGVKAGQLMPLEEAPTHNLDLFS